MCEWLRLSDSREQCKVRGLRFAWPIMSSREGLGDASAREARTLLSGLLSECKSGLHRCPVQVADKRPVEVFRGQGKALVDFG
jgi:hypothetical protein